MDDVGLKERQDRHLFISDILHYNRERREVRGMKAKRTFKDPLFLCYSIFVQKAVQKAWEKF